MEAGTAGTGGAGGTGGTGGGTPTCAAGERAFGGHCNVRTTAAQTYDNALATCRARGTGWSLAEIGSASENGFVSTLIGTIESWLGGNDRTTEGRWACQSTDTQFWQAGATGSAVGAAFTNWTSDEPNDAGGADCLRMIAGGAWRDIPCANTFQAVCER